MVDVWRFVPLAGVLVFFGLGIGVRAWLHARRYGSSGIVLFRRGAPSERLLGSLGILLPVVLLGQATVAAVAPEMARGVAPEALALRLRPLGATLLFGGAVLMFVAQLDMGASWRVGLEHERAGALVTGGLYRYSRNPIYLFMFVAFAGFAVLLPTWPLLLVLAVSAIGWRVWVVRVEEAHLLAIYGEAYRAYAARVGRFVPWIGRLRRTGTHDPRR